MTQPRCFLTARWESLAMLNYEIDPAILQPLLPAGTELDTYGGRSYVSVVGFLFRDTRVCGLSVPWHRHFPEVNLRFYVVRNLPGERRRGVAFIKEIVPRPAVSLVARRFYNENYQTLPMRYRADSPANIQYHWKQSGAWQGIDLQASGTPVPAEPDSLEEFITEHYWGYSAQPNGTSLEYLVEHPRWNLWPRGAAQLKCNIAKLYGQPFTAALSAPPASAFLCDGSAVAVYAGQRVTAVETATVAGVCGEK